MALLLSRRRWTALIVALIMAGTDQRGLAQTGVDRPSPRRTSDYNSPSWPEWARRGGLALTLALTFVAWRSLHRGRGRSQVCSWFFGLDGVGYSRALYGPLAHRCRFRMAVGDRVRILGGGGVHLRGRLERLQPKEGLIAIGSAVVVTVVFGLVTWVGWRRAGLPQPAVHAISDIGQAVQSLDPYSTTLFGRSMEPVGSSVVSDQQPSIRRSACGWAIADLPTIDNLHGSTGRDHQSGGFPPLL